MRFPHGGHDFGLGSGEAIANRRTDRSAAMTSSLMLASGCHGYGHRFRRDSVSTLMPLPHVYLRRILEVRRRVQPLKHRWWSPDSGHRV